MYCIKPPFVCYSVRRAAYERNLYVRYRLLFRAWEQYRQAPVIRAVESLQQLRTHPDCTVCHVDHLHGWREQVKVTGERELA